MKRDLMVFILGLLFGFGAGYIYWYGGLASWFILFPFAFALLVIPLFAVHHPYLIWQSSIVIPAVFYAVYWYLIHKPNSSFPPNSDVIWQFYRWHVFDPPFKFWLGSSVISAPFVVSKALFKKATKMKEKSLR